MTAPVKKELVLINPRLSYTFFNFLQAKYAENPIPHALLTLAALTPKDYQVAIVNQKPFWAAKDFGPGKLVGITCLTAAVSEAYELADRFRGAGSRVVLGGPHASALPEEAQGHADSVVVGEAESVWKDVLADFENGRLRPVYKGEPLEDFFTPVFDYFSRLDPSVLRRSGVHTDRGCRYNCDFCSRLSHWHRPVRREQVLVLVRRIRDSRRRFFFSKPSFGFATDNIYSDPVYAKELFRQMVPLGVRWGANCSIDMGFDEEALRLAQESGCGMLFIGFETTHPGDLKKTSAAGLRSLEDYRAAIANIRRHGIKVVGSFIIGLNGQGHLDYLKLLWFLVRARLYILILTILTPFPGSALFERLKKEGRIFSFDWRKYFFLFCVFKPRKISVAGVYFWFFLIRVASVFFTPRLLLLAASCALALAIGDEIGRSLFGFLRGAF